MKGFHLASGSLFAIVSGAWLVRLMLAWPIVVNGYDVPVWFSVIPAVVTGGFAVWAFRLAPAKSM